MKIAIDARFYRTSTGGIGRYTRALLKEIAQIDKKNLYTIYITPADCKEYQLQAKNFTTKVVPINHYSLAEQTKFLSILNKERFDLVHFTNFNHPILYRGKFIVTIHDLTMMLYPAGQKQKSFMKKQAFNLVMNHATKKAEQIIAVSRATKTDLINLLKIPQEKIKVIYEGIDESYWPSAFSSQKIHKSSTNNRKLITENRELKALLENYKISKPYLLFVSQWRPHKGILQLIKAFEILKSAYKIPHKLVIVGKANLDFPEIPYALSHTPYANNIITSGFIEEKDLPTIYREAELFVFPSFYEGFGFGPLEAMACGTAVTASNTSCMPEILADAAIYFNPHNPSDMAEKIMQVLTNPKLRKSLISHGQIQVKKYSWVKMAKETLQIYQKLLY